MKRFLSALVVSAITAFLFICNIPTGAYTYPLDRDNARSLVLVTNTPMPPPSAQSTPVYAPQIAAVEAMEAVPMETIDIVFIGILFVIGVLVWALVRSNFITANLIPSDVVKEIIRATVTTALDAIDNRAALTETTTDDELAKLVREQVTAALKQAGIVVAPTTETPDAG